MPDHAKNILDLQYNKYLQYYTTSIIILFTFMIGVGLALITRQIDITDLGSMLFMALFTILVTLIIVFRMFDFRSHCRNILKEIRRL